MLLRIVGAATAAWMLGTPSTAPAQTPTIATSVTFTLPVNLTQLSPDLERVRLACDIEPSEVLQYPSLMRVYSPTSEQWPWKNELPVVAGQVVATMSVVIPIAADWLQNPIGQTAQYGCALLGFSRSAQQWGFFSDAAPAGSPFLVRGLPNSISGTFVWGAP